MAGPVDDPEDNEKDKKPIIPLGARPCQRRCSSKHTHTSGPKPTLGCHCRACFKRSARRLTPRRAASPPRRRG
jgi:hypothetical protein